MPKVISSPLTQVLDRMRKFIVNHQIPRDVYKRYSDNLKRLRPSCSSKDIYHFMSDMLNSQVFPNAFIISQLIKLLGQKKAMNDVIALHYIAVNKGVANDYTFNSTINAIAKSAKPDARLARDLLKEAIALKFANAITFNSTIDAIAKSEKPDAREACRLLEEAKARGFANAIT